MWIQGDFVPPGSGRCWKRRIDICICYLLVHQYNCGGGAGGGMSDKTKLLKRCLGFLQGGVSGYRVHILIFTSPSKQNKKRCKEETHFEGTWCFSALFFPHSLMWNLAARRYLFAVSKFNLSSLGFLLSCIWKEKGRLLGLQWKRISFEYLHWEIEISVRLFII